MYIKSYNTRRFAGLKDVEVTFKEGLNVIVGPNEAGKSTIIEGIHATLFQDVKLLKNNNRDIDFRKDFMPHPNGDFIDGNVTISRKGKNFTLKKEWGSSELLELIADDKSLIKEKSRVDSIMGDILQFGEATYSNIVFAKQKYIKDALDNIIKNKGVSQEVNDIIRNTLMDLDGVSLDEIENKLNLAVDKLYSNWDIEKNGPAKNRSVTDQWKQKVGDILATFYTKEQVKLDMSEVKNLEEILEKATTKRLEVSKKIEELKVEKKKLESLEEDVNKRAVLDVSMDPIKKDIDSLFAINRQWPLTVENIKNLSNLMEKLKEKKAGLQKEKANIDKVVRKAFLEEKLKKAEEILAKIKISHEKLKGISKITNEDLKDLNALNNLKSKLSTTMQAGKMLAVLKKSGSSKAYISNDFNEKVELSINKEFTANGLINITYGEDFEVEIKTGEVDFDQLNKDYNITEKKLKYLLNKLKITSIEEGRYNLEKIKKLSDEIENLKKDLKRNLDDLTIENIKAEIESLKDFTSARSLSEIEKDLEDLSKEENETSFELRTKNAEVKLWTDTYKSHDNLLNVILEKRGKLNVMEADLSKLTELPAEFTSAKQFKERLTYVKSTLSNLESDFVNIILPNFYEAEKKLAGPTYLELKRDLVEAEKAFNKNIKKGRTLLKVLESFNKTKQAQLLNPMESLEKEFLTYLNLTTAGRYAGGEIDDNFNLKIKSNFNHLPPDLLSAGTYDAVTLSLRLALVSHIYNDRKGFVVLDDVLVDLDPQRKKAAILLIQDFAKKHQVIFTTCNPETAKMLGGNIIEV